MLSPKFPHLFPEIDSSVAHALALSGLPVYVASSQFGSIPFLFASLIQQLIPGAAGELS